MRQTIRVRRLRFHVPAPVRRRAALLALTTIVALGIGATAQAAEPNGNGKRAGFVLQEPSDFRFDAPTVSVGLRAGFVNNRAEGEIFDFLTSELTLESSDFDSPGFAADIGLRVADRADIVFGFEVSHRSRRSEFRDLIGSDDLPIVQDTRFTQVPLTASLKLYLVSRGRQVGQYAWVPNKVLPYVGGGGGATYFRLEQEGEFVDFRDNVIFEDFFESDGWTFSAHAFGGVEIQLNPSLNLVFEGRYQWAEADLTGSFIGFDPIDLDGLRIMGGVSFKL